MKKNMLRMIVCFLCLTMVSLTSLVNAQNRNTGTSTLKRSYLILNLTDLNDLPKANRWLFKEHAADTININGPILACYSTYRALPIPEGGNLYGAYNWRMTEHYWREDPFPPGNELNQGTAFKEIWVDGYNEMIGNPVNSVKRADWSE